MATTADTEKVLETLKIAGVPVLKVQKGQKIIYKLAEYVSAETLSFQQRQRITQEIMKLHAVAAMSASASAATSSRSPTTYHDPRSLSLQVSSAHQALARSPMISPTGTSPPSAEEYYHQQAVRQRFSAALMQDHRRVVQPDVKKPFQSLDDAIESLLPYHVFQYTEYDLSNDDDAFQKDQRRNWRHFEKRSRELEERTDTLIKRIAQRSIPPELEMLCEKLVVDNERNMLAMLRKGYDQYVMATQAQGGTISFQAFPHSLASAKVVPGTSSLSSSMLSTATAQASPETPDVDSIDHDDDEEEDENDDEADSNQSGSGDEDAEQSDDDETENGYES